MGELTGYWDGDNRAGIRTHVVVLALSAFCNTATQLISQAVRGTLPLIHPHGRNEIGVYKTRLDRSLRGVVLNPNVHSALVVGYEPKSTQAFVDAVRRDTRKPIESVLVLEGGTWAAVRAGAEVALEFVIAASASRRDSIEIKNLVFGVKCGGSDATSGIASNPAVGCAVDRIIEAGGTVIFSETTEIMGAEHILARRASTEEVAKKIYRAVQENEQLATSVGIDLLGVNPVPDNIRGGITTIEEKSLGAILKTGTARIEDVVEYGERPARPGLYFMDSPSAAAEVMTGLSAAGAQMILFSTGTGNPVGNPITPVLKITSHPRTATHMKEHIDVDVSEMITGSASAREAGDRIFDAAVRVINGRLTKAEVVGHMELRLSRLGCERDVTRMKAIVLTGAAGAMGTAVVELLAARGVNTLCVDRDPVGLERVVETFSALGADLCPAVADVTSASDVERCVSLAVRRWGGLDGIFNIAAILGPPRPFLDTTMETYDEIMRVNARGVWLGMKYALPALLARGGGSIVNVGSYAAIRGTPNIAAYAASKHAVVGMTKTVAVEYATKNIRANVLCPGSMDTPMMRQMFPIHGGGDAAEGERISLAKIPQRRLARPDELASTGVWLLLDAPEHLSGQVIMIDGARSAS